MLKIDSQSKTLHSLGRRRLQPAPLFDRFPVAELVANSPDVFFADLGRALFLISANVPVTYDGDRRADLLLLDPDGRLYVGRFQHGNEKIDLVDALEDAGCIAGWRPERVLALLDEGRRETLGQAFLRAPVERINQEQGILLLAESFDADVLASAGWLKARYGVHIDCYQLRSAVDALTSIEYLSSIDLAPQVDRIYQRRKSADADEAPWPAEAVPDISDGPFPPEKPQPGNTQAAAPAEPPAPEPEPVQPAPVQPEPPAAEAAPESAEPVQAADAPAPPPQPVEPLEAEVAAALSAEPPQPAPEEQTFFRQELPPEEDPLAEIIAGREAPEPDEEPMVPALSDRRSAGRSRDYQARRLRLDYFGRLLGARLVDFSANGLGVEALSPLPVGAEIGISGEIIGESGAVGIEGRAKVEHCRSTQEGVCRIGFSLENAVITELDDPESFDRR
jgi:hypothetical protein